MKNINNILKLKEKIEKNSLIISEVKIEKLLIDSLAYDWEFNKTQLEIVKERKNYIQKHFTEGNIKLLQIELKDILEHLKEKTLQKNPNLLCLFMIEYINKNWSDVFGTGSRKVQLDLKEWIFTTEASLENISKLLFKFLNKTPLLRYNYSKWIYITNYLLNIIWIPGIIFSYNDRKRIIRSVDHYIDFQKEFLITVEGELNKIIAEGLYKDQIIGTGMLRKIKWIKNPYITPGTWWYWEDRKKYTFIKK